MQASDPTTANLQGPTRLLARHREEGLTVAELLISLVVAGILAAIAVPAYTSTISNMRLNSTAAAVSGAISKTRYQALMTSQIYTMAITEPSNSYVVTNISTATAAVAVPLPSHLVAINSNTPATYTYTFCPGGTVYGAGSSGTYCPNSSAIPTLALSYGSREIDISVSGVGNVTSKTIR